MKHLNPNVFLIGAQKAATTSLFDWMAQHPEVCAPFSMKDTPFFIDDTLYNKGLEFLHKVYQTEYQGEPVILNGSANIIYFEKALLRIAALDPGAKLILVLRNPVDRAISAFNFARKRNMEPLTLEEAIDAEPERIKKGDLRVLSNNTYLDHGRYFHQIQRLHSIFPPEQLLVLFYEDLRNKPEAVIEKTYRFIGVDPAFVPEFKTLNKTGAVRFRWIRNLIYSQSRAKQFLVRNVIDRWFPYDLKYRTKIFFLNLVTKRKTDPNENRGTDPKTLKRMKELLSEDTKQLEALLEKDLSAWK